jgi:hypothetical protein
MIAFLRILAGIPSTVSLASLENNRDVRALVLTKGRARGFLIRSLLTLLIFSFMTSVLQTTFAAEARAAAPPSLLSAGLTNGGPRIQFANAVWDFGRLEAGRTVTNFYTFTNTGDHLLEIKGIRSSCGCTAATNWTRQAEPGQTGVIPVLFNSGEISGPLAKNLWVSCNDPVQSNVVLYITGTVWKPIDALPAIAMFNFGPDFQTNETRVLRLVSNLEEPLRIEEPACANPAFRAELKTVKEGKEYEVRVMVIPPLPPGVSSANITLKTSSTTMPVVNLTGYAMVQPSITVVPPRLILPAGKLAKVERFAFSIRSTSTNALSLTEPTIDTPRGEVQVQEVEPGRTFKLLLSLPEGFKIPAGKQLEARVKTNHPQLPILKVPILQLVDPDEAVEPASAPAAKAREGGA